MTELQPVVTEIQRDRWQRPLIIPPDGGRAVAYTRCTTYVDVLDDKYNLQKWMQRMVAVGIAARPDLHLSASSLASDPDGNKKALDDLCENAVEAAKGSAKATIGTALHAYVERHNLGLDLGIVPAEYRRHIDNYVVATAAVHPVHVERFTVQDDLKVGGTPDLLAHVDGVDGLVVCDLKTGPSTLKYGALKVAMQMAVYAHSALYDPATGARSDLAGIRLDRGLVIALDSETAECSLHWVDLAAGWEAVQVATQVRMWRTRKDLLQPAVLPAQPLPLRPATPIDAALDAAIASASSRDELLALWSEAARAGRWTDAHTEATKQRLATLAAA